MAEKWWKSSFVDLVHCHPRNRSICHSWPGEEKSEDEPTTFGMCRRRRLGSRKEETQKAGKYEKRKCNRFRIRICAVKIGLEKKFFFLLSNRHRVCYALSGLSVGRV